MGILSNRQWANMGPAEARARHEGPEAVWPSGDEAGRFRASPQQQQLSLGPEADWKPEPHQQTPQQFADDPRSWWHGRFANRLTTAGGAKEGFHAGSKGAAQIRVEQNYSRHGDQGKIPHLFPLRLTGKMGNRIDHYIGVGGPVNSGVGDSPENTSPDFERHDALGHNPPHGYFYENNIEDPGHISVGVPRRKGFLSTHKELVKGAQEAGEYVHPNIAWAAKKAPEHTGEDAVAHKREYIDWRGRQERAELGAELGAPPEHRSSSVFSNTHNPGYSMDRVNFTTAGGKTGQVFRYRGGNVMDGPQWEGSTIPGWGQRRK